MRAGCVVVHLRKTRGQRNNELWSTPAPMCNAELGPLNPLWVHFHLPTYPLWTLLWLQGQRGSDWLHRRRTLTRQTTEQPLLAPSPSPSPQRRGTRPLSKTADEQQQVRLANECRIVSLVG